MCNCRKELEAALAEHYAKKTGASNVQIELQGYGFSIVDNTMVMVGYMPYKVQALHPKKGGGHSEKRKTEVMHFKHCPFCGELYLPAKTLPEAATPEPAHGG